MTGTFFGATEKKPIRKDERVSDRSIAPATTGAHQRQEWGWASSCQRIACSMLTTETPEEEKRRLSALRALGVLDTPPEPELDAITMLAADRFEAPIALISLVDEDRQWFKSRVGLEVEQTDRSVAFCGYTIQTDEVLAVLDARADARFCTNPLVTGEPSIRFYAGTPLILSSGERVGSLCVIDTEPHAKFSDRDCRSLRLMARQVVSHLELRRLRSVQRISQLIADTTTDAFVSTDGEGRVIYWNQGAERTFGFTAEEAVGAPLDLIVPPEHLGAHQAGLDRLRAGGGARLVGKTIEVPAVHKDGSRLMTELTLGMWRDPESGQPAGYASVMRDVSQRKMTEAKLADQIAAIEAAQEGISIADTSGIHHYMNEAFLRLFGLPPASVDIPWSHLIAPHDRDRVMEVLRGLPDGANWSDDVVGLTAEGVLLDLEVSLTRREQAIVGVVRDISVRRAEAREMAKLREQLLVAQRQEVIGELASGLAHDLGNLIAAISGSAALIQGFADSESSRHAARIEAAAADAASLINKMLSLGRRAPQYESHNACAVTRDVGDLLRASLPSDYRLAFEVDSAPVMITADRTELVQVLLNIGLNARDALRDSPLPTIILGVRRLDDAPEGVVLAQGTMPRGPIVHFSITDTGCGMSADEVRNIFLPFYTRKEKRGTGLGLAMVANIIAAVGGGIAVRTEQAKGTTFDIFWPLTPLPDVGGTVINFEGVVEGGLQGMTILLADDEPAVVETLAAMFEHAGAEVGPCIDPHDALDALTDDPDAWTVLVTDYDMPGMDGAELASAAREIRPDLPILLITALPDAARSRSQKGELFDAISGKLVNATGLVGAVHSAISNRRAKI